MPPRNGAAQRQGGLRLSSASRANTQGGRKARVSKRRRRSQKSRAPTSSTVDSQQSAERSVLCAGKHPVPATSALGQLVSALERFRGRSPLPASPEVQPYVDARVERLSRRIQGLQRPVGPRFLLIHQSGLLRPTARCPQIPAREALIHEGSISLIVPSSTAEPTSQRTGPLPRTASRQVACCCVLLGNGLLLLDRVQPGAAEPGKDYVLVQVVEELDLCWLDIHDVTSSQSSLGGRRPHSFSLVCPDKVLILACEHDEAKTAWISQLSRRLGQHVKVEAEVKETQAAATGHATARPEPAAASNAPPGSPDDRLHSSTDTTGSIGGLIPVAAPVSSAEKRYRRRQLTRMSRLTREKLLFAAGTASATQACDSSSRAKRRRRPRGSQGSDGRTLNLAVASPSTGKLAVAPHRAEKGDDTCSAEALSNSVWLVPTSSRPLGRTGSRALADAAVESPQDLSIGPVKDSDTTGALVESLTAELVSLRKNIDKVVAEGVREALQRQGSEVAPAPSTHPPKRQERAQLAAPIEKNEQEHEHEQQQAQIQGLQSELGATSFRTSSIELQRSPRVQGDQAVMGIERCSCRAREICSICAPEPTQVRVRALSPRKLAGVHSSDKSKRKRTQGAAEMLGCAGRRRRRTGVMK